MRYILKSKKINFESIIESEDIPVNQFWTKSLFPRPSLKCLKIDLFLINHYISTTWPFPAFLQGSWNHSWCDANPLKIRLSNWNCYFLTDEPFPDILHKIMSHLICLEWIWNLQCTISDKYLLFQSQAILRHPVWSSAL